LVRGFAQRFETMSQVAGEIAELEGYGLSTDELGRYTERIDAVTKDQLEAAAGKYLSTDDAILLVVGDGEKVADGLSTLDFGELKRLDVEGEPLD
jgi:zinc protease